MLAKKVDKIKFFVYLFIAQGVLMPVDELILRTLEEANRAFLMDAKTAAALPPLAHRHIGQMLRVTFMWEGAQHQVETRVHSAHIVIMTSSELHLQVDARQFLGTRMIDGVVAKTDGTFILIGLHPAYNSTKKEAVPCEVYVHHS